MDLNRTVENVLRKKKENRKHVSEENYCICIELKTNFWWNIDTTPKRGHIWKYLTLDNDGKNG